MKRFYDDEKSAHIVSKIGGLLKNILVSQEHDHVVDIVMHQLCSNTGLDVHKAAYFVDNPDFDCLHGVTGYCSDEMGKYQCDWSDREKFAHTIVNTPFNKDVKSLRYKSMKRTGKLDDDVVKDIAQKLKIQNPGYCSWDMKHNNHGIFVYQKQDIPDHMQNSVHDAVCLLGFCPLF